MEAKYESDYKCSQGYVQPRDGEEQHLCHVLPDDLQDQRRCKQWIRERF
jgi:hypothetical protein